VRIFSINSGPKIEEHSTQLQRNPISRKKCGAGGIKMEEKMKEKEKTYKCSTEEFNLAIQVARSCQGQRPIQLFYRTEITRIIHVMASAYYKSSSMLPSIFQRIQQEEEHTT
jgi:hypothetical protein